MYPPQCPICADYWVREGRPMGDYLIVSRGGHIPGVHDSCRPTPPPCDNSGAGRRRGGGGGGGGSGSESGGGGGGGKRGNAGVNMSGHGKATHGAGQIGNINVERGGTLNIGK